MNALLFSLLLAFSVPALAQKPMDCDAESETILAQKFFPSPFGKSAWTIASSEAAAIVEEVRVLGVAHPKKELSKIEVLVCTSDYPIPALSLADKSQDNHTKLAKQRSMNLKQQLNKQPIPSDVSFKICGPVFNPQDKNLRFVVQGQSGALYDEAMSNLAKDSELIKLYQEMTLIENFAKVKELYPQPFLAKYKPFQGYRMKVFAKSKCLPSKSKSEVKTPSGKIQ